MVMMICAKYGKNASRIADFFFKVKAKKLEKFAKNWNFGFFFYKQMTPSNGSDYLWQI